MVEAARWVDLSGRVAHVTGAANGIGAAIVVEDRHVDAHALIRGEVLGSLCEARVELLPRSRGTDPVHGRILDQ